MDESTIVFENKKFPKSIEKEVKEALAYFPQLKETAIDFVFKKQIKKSTMQAQPTIRSLFRPRSHRKYVIYISKKIQIESKELFILDIPKDVLVGWLGHELGHIMDYSNRGFFNMLVLGFKYLYSKSHIQEVERRADVYAIKNGMASFIIKTKNFILNHADISEKYKKKLRRLYLSPEEVMHIINK